MTMAPGRRLACILTGFCLLGTSALQPAIAGIITTRTAMELESREAALTDINRLLTREDVRSALVALGVDPGMAAERVNAMTNAELELLREKMGELPAGSAGVIEVVGIVAVVLIILELVGVTNIFNAF